MVRWRVSGVEEPSAHALLTEYFASRAATFPPHMGAYRTVFPTAEQFVEPNGLFLVGAVDGEDVACGGIRSLSPWRFEVKHLWVQPQLRGAGVGRALLVELEQRSQRLGATELVLDTNASQAAAAALYRSAGYAEIEPYNDNANATHWFAKGLD